MSVNIRDKIGKLNSIQRKKVEARAAEIITEEMSLRDLREARKLTQARVAKIQGTVVLTVVIGVDGHAADITLVRSIGFGLDEKALDAIMQWQFQPGAQNGLPVPVQAQIEVNFRLL